MDRTLLTHLPVVLAVARHRSFRRAGAELGIGSSAVSHAIRAVEDRLGTPLFARTTRTVSLTEAGAIFLESADRAAEDLARAVDRLREGQAQVSGLLRLNVPRIAWPLAITSVLLEVAKRHPRLTVEVITDDAVTDVVADGFDAGVRLGEMIAQDMVAVRLTSPFRMIAAAAPSYLVHAPQLKTVGDLCRHNCIGYRLLGSGTIYAWDLTDDGKEVRVAVEGNVRVSDPLSARDLAVKGLGVAYLAEPLIAAELAEGRLIDVLPTAAVTEPGLFLYFPQRARLDTKLRALLDVLHGRSAG
jgi:DNA-binding transcriptional LysR family regulator